MKNSIVKKFILVFAIAFVFIPFSFALYSSTDDVVELTSSNFDSLVMKSNELWFVEFYAPWCGHCKNMVPEWKKAATAMKGMVKFGAVDMTKHESFGPKYNVQGFPTVKIFGANKNTPSDYNGSRSAKDFVNAAIKEVRAIAAARLGISKSSSSSSQNSKEPEKDGKVFQLTDSNFDKEVLQTEDIWFVSFTAPWCGHCKNLKPEWSKAANNLEGKVKMGNVDCTQYQSLCGKYDVRGYPTIKFFKAGIENKKSPVAYEGPRQSSDISTYALNEWEKNSPAPIPVELVDQDGMQKCGSSSLCVLSILPNLLDTQASGRNAYISSLKEAAKKLKRHNISWIWTVANAYPKLESILEIGGAGYPALSVMNQSKGKCAPMVSAFTADNIVEFINNVLSGRESVFSYGSLPPIESRTPWDGKDAASPKSEL